MILSILSCILGISILLSGWWTSGVYPKMSSSGVFLVVLDGHELCMYCAGGSHLDHSFWFCEQTVLRYCSKDWLVLSLCPSVWGWNAVLRFCLIPSMRHSSLENRAVNCVFLSE